LDLEEGTAVIAGDRFRKAIEELVDNAFKFSRPGNAVALSSFVTERTFTITITDHGRE
jgi:signal transduction histidine kinase